MALDPDIPADARAAAKAVTAPLRAPITAPPTKQDVTLGFMKATGLTVQDTLAQYILAQKTLSDMSEILADKSKDIKPAALDELGNAKIALKAQTDALFTNLANAKGWDEKTAELTRKQIDDLAGTKTAKTAYDTAAKAHGIEGFNKLSSDNQSQLEKESERRADLLRNLREYNPKNPSASSSLFANLGLGMEKPTEVDAAGMYKVGQKFVRQLADDGKLPGWSDKKVAEQGALLGVLYHGMMNNTAAQIRSGIQYVVGGIGYTLSDTYKTITQNGKEVEFSKFSEFVKAHFTDKDANKQDLTDFWESAKKAGFNITEDMKKSLFQTTPLKLTSDVRVARMCDIWHEMNRPGPLTKSSLGFEQTLSAEQLAQLPEDLVTRLLAQKAAEKNTTPDKVSLNLNDISFAIDRSGLAKFATMFTGAMAHAPAQSGQEAYTMGGYHDQKITAWSYAGGQPAAHMMQYARASINGGSRTTFDYRQKPIEDVRRFDVANVNDRDVSAPTSVGGAHRREPENGLAPRN